MFRPLTGAESKKSTAAKRKANKSLKHGTRPHGKTKLIEGRPAIISIQGCQIYVDYSKLRKINSTLRKDWRYTTIRIGHVGAHDPKPVLLLSYQNDWSLAKGNLEMYELPEYQRELLVDLPIIEVQQRG